MSKSAAHARRGTRLAALTAGTAVVALLAAGCSSTASSSPSSAASPDDGTKLTMWARHMDGDLPKLLVDAYNKTHKNQIELTIIPGDGYQQKVGAAAGSNGLPDILAADVVYSPNYVKQGLFQDITTSLKALTFYDSLTPAHSQAASQGGKVFGAPLAVDSSLIIYNKDLFTKAGLDPEAPPTSFADIEKDATAIRALGGDTYGFYFAGSCPGCNAYTMLPYASAAGTPPLVKDGSKSDIKSDALQQTMAMYKKLWDADAIPQGAKGDDGSTWSTAFNAGKVGIIPIGSFDFGALKDATFKWGVTPLPSPDGSASGTFVGGDMVGITRDSKHAAQAWDFIAWELGDDAQVNVVAKSGNLPSRVDLAGNKYSAADPRIVATIKGLANGYTPSSSAYGPIFNDNTGPWLAGIRGSVFGGDAGALAKAQDAAQKILDDAS